MPENMPGKRGRPSRDSQQALAVQLQSLTAAQEGVSFRTLRLTGERADVAQYWGRGAFYEAVRLYASEAFDLLVRPATAILEEQLSNEQDFFHGGGGLDTRFLALLEEEVPLWRSKYRFFPCGDSGPKSDDGPGWLSADIISSFIYWDRKAEPFPLRAFWRGRWVPELDNVYYPEPDPLQEDFDYPEPIFDPDGTGLLITPNPDSLELRALLRIELVKTEVDSSGALVPVVRSHKEVRNELRKRLMAYIDVELPGAMQAAAERGIAKPSETSLASMMRRYVLKQFRRLDSLDIAAGEVRGDPACMDEPTEEERKDHDWSARRRDIDDDIKHAGELLGVRAKPFAPGPRPKRSLAERRA